LKKAGVFCPFFDFFCTLIVDMLYRQGRWINPKGVGNAGCGNSKYESLPLKRQAGFRVAQCGSASLKCLNKFLPGAPGLGMTGSEKK